MDRAFAIYLKPSQRPYGGNYGGREGQAALLAVQAQQIGYPDMTSVVYRTLAMRPVAGMDDFSPLRAQESCVVMATLLALVDAPAARQMLQTIEPGSDAIGSGSSGVGRDNWFKAWALVNPQHAADLAEKELAAAKDAAAKQRAEMASRAMVELWLAAPSERRTQVSRRFYQMIGLNEEL